MFTQRLRNTPSEKATDFLVKDGWGYYLQHGAMLASLHQEHVLTSFGCCGWGGGGRLAWPCGLQMLMSAL